ncbi:secreted RxLR effector protein 161-like [Chelonus insularis]|uniref:secreted RxLR effector protein 161-like n=1 Tax=Chelonus insularis TaxID=460826 RepID=UPI00158B96BB|nr:secreted RxLR effector protein 161-like [Chelonus insularis]
MVTDPENSINDSPLDKSKPYREAIGSLLYLTTISRPYICFSVNYLSRFNNKPMKSHWKIIRRVLQYVKGTTKFGICFNGDKSLSVSSDFDYGGDSETGHSTSGVLPLRGGPIVWLTQKHCTVSNSTAEAENRAAVLAKDKVCWIRRLAEELNQLRTSQSTSHYIDNQSAIHMLKNTHEGKITKGEKHIEISRKFIQQQIKTTVAPVYVRRKDQLADILTKPLLRKHFKCLRSKIIKEECLE